jgi:hypothetical protein
VIPQGDPTTDLPSTLSSLSLYEGNFEGGFAGWTLCEPVPRRSVRLVARAGCSLQSRIAYALDWPPYDWANFDSAAGGASFTACGGAAVWVGGGVAVGVVTLGTVTQGSS